MCLVYLIAKRGASVSSDDKKNKFNLKDVYS